MIATDSSHPMIGTMGLPRCPLCARPEARRHFFKEGIPYYRCDACTFCFAVPERNPNLENLLNDFEPSYLQYLQADAADTVNFDAQWEWMKRFGVETTSGTLLDVGCGSGKWVRYLRHRHVEAFGLEPNAAIVGRFLPEHEWFTHGEVTHENAATGRRYRVLTAFDVLEHVADPMGFLNRIADLTEPGGWVFLSLPDVGSVPARLMGRSWHFFCSYHLSYFSPATLSRAAHRTGLDIVHVSHRGRYRSMGYAFRYMFEFLLRRSAPAVLSTFDRWYVPLNIRDTMYVCLRKHENGHPSNARPSPAADAVTPSR